MFTRFYNLFTGSIIAVLVALLSVNFLPSELFSDFPFEPRSVAPPDYDSVKPQQWNTLLSDKPVEYIQVNQILGPESIAISNEGLVYTGLADGRLIELNPAQKYKIRQVLRFKESSSCNDNVALQPVECGRFLQLRFTNNTLFAIEANTGLYSIDVKTGTKKLVGPSPPLAKTNLYNSFAFDPVEPNLVYITVSSTKWNLQNIIWSFCELETSGLLIALDITTGKRVIVLDQLMVANGVDIDRSRDRLLLSETSGSQISSVPLAAVRDGFKNAKDGDRITSRVEKNHLIPIVPGNPDNIIVQGDIAYIAIPFVKNNGKDTVDLLATMPHLRKTIGRSMYGLGKALELFSKNVFQHPSIEALYKDLMSGHLNYRLTNTDRSAVLEYNLSTGSSRLLGSNAFSFVSEAVMDNSGQLLLGSFRSPFIVRTKV